MRLYRTTRGAVVENAGFLVALDDEWDTLITREDLFELLQRRSNNTAGTAVPPAVPQTEPQTGPQQPLAPIGNQEVWAAGVTYFRSRSARMEESETAGGADFYDRVYEAERPELFFKATASRVVGPGDRIRIRRDSKWNVPEPELTLLVSPGARILGYTIGNDVSSRDIEGENPLYLPQAKVYDGSCALGPAILVTPSPPPAETEIRMQIVRAGAEVFSGKTTLAAMKRAPASLVEFLFRETSFPYGCFLLTGTGVIPPGSFSLQSGDRVRIEIPPVGVLENFVG